MLHPDFKSAVWRGTTNTEGEVIGISFDMADGAVIRLRVPCASARQCAVSILGYVDSKNSHSDKSSGSPSDDVSTQRE